MERTNLEQALLRGNSFLWRLCIHSLYQSCISDAWMNKWPSCLRLCYVCSAPSSSALPFTHRTRRRFISMSFLNLLIVLESPLPVKISRLTVLFFFIICSEASTSLRHLHVALWLNQLASLSSDHSAFYLFALSTSDQAWKILHFSFTSLPFITHLHPLQSSLHPVFYLLVLLSIPNFALRSLSIPPFIFSRSQPPYTALLLLAPLDSPLPSFPSSYSITFTWCSAASEAVCKISSPSVEPSGSWQDTAPHVRRDPQPGSNWTCQRGNWRLGAQDGWRCTM